MPIKTEQNDGKVLMFLYEQTKAENKEFFSGEEIKIGTQLNAPQINEAIKLLAGSKLVETHGTYGTLPYDFQVVSINSDGKRQVEDTNKKALQSQVDMDFSNSINSFAAFYHTVRGATRVEKVYPLLFSLEELSSLGKAAKICRILERYKSDRKNLKIALGKIIELHYEYSKEHVFDLKTIVSGLGFELNDKLSLIDKSDGGQFEYEVALSFAGEDRKYAEELAKSLKSKKISVFYDDFEKSKLWGEDLYAHLSELYSKKAHYCVMFLSKNYASKAWTTHERKAAQERALKESRAYILPIRLDKTPIAGILDTIAYVDWQKEGVNKITQYITEKLNPERGKTESKVLVPSPKSWNPLPVIKFNVMGVHLKRALPQVGWELTNHSPYQLKIRIEVHPWLGKRDLFPLVLDADINGKKSYSAEPNSIVWTNGTFTLPQECVASTEELVLEIRSFVTDVNEPQKGEHGMLSSTWKYVIAGDYWYYYPQGP
jgi:hypothetical protein